MLKYVNILFSIFNGISFLLAMFFLITLSIFSIKNKYQDTFSITFILFFIFYSIICTVGQLCMKTLCENYIYSFLVLLTYLLIFFCECLIVFSLYTFKDFLLNFFKNSENSINAIVDIFNDDIDTYRILILGHVVFMVNKFIIFYL